MSALAFAWAVVVLVVAFLGTFFFASYCLSGLFGPDAFISRGVSAFLIDIAAGGVCYLVAHAMARSLSSVPGKVYVLRLVFMGVLLLLWWGLFFRMHPNHNGHPYGWAAEIGGKYGKHTIWAWCGAALASLPAKEQRENPDGHRPPLDGTNP